MHTSVFRETNLLPLERIVLIAEHVIMLRVLEEQWLEQMDELFKEEEGGLGLIELLQAPKQLEEIESDIRITRIKVYKVIKSHSQYLTSGMKNKFHL